MELAPNLSWKEVLYGLDHPGFYIKDRAELRLIISALTLAFQSQGTPLPIEFFFQAWNNAEGQLSMLSQLIRNPDVLCLADHPHSPVNVEILKSPPEAENKKMANWKCIGLLEALLNLMENAGLHGQVQELLKEPVQQCPDVLVLGLLQSTQPMTKLRQELLGTLVPVFLGNHPNSTIILHHAWHNPSPLVKPLVMHAMAEWYMRAEHDQTRLSRILDLAQDLKALSLLLNVQRFPFIIDLACLASRREYLKLDKWLSDKMREHGEPFITACVNFLHQRCPQISGKKDDAGMKAGQLPGETVTIMLSCLQVWTGNVSQELSDMISTMMSNCAALNRARAQPPPGVMKSIRPGSAVDVSFPPGTMNSQLFPPPGVDSLGGLSSNLSSMALGPPASSTFGVNIGPNLPGATPAPGSPGKVFPGMSMLDSGIECNFFIILKLSLVTDFGLVRDEPVGDGGAADEQQPEPEHVLHLLEPDGQRARFVERHRARAAQRVDGEQRDPVGHRRARRLGHGRVARLGGERAPDAGQSAHGAGEAPGRRVQRLRRHAPASVQGNISSHKVLYHIL